MTGKVFRVKVHESGIQALEDLLSHDPELLVIAGPDDEPYGLLSDEAYDALVALLNNLKSPFREEVGGAA